MRQKEAEAWALQMLRDTPQKLLLANEPLTTIVVARNEREHLTLALRVRWAGDFSS